MRAQRAPRDAVDTTNPLAPRAGHLMVVAGNRGNARDQGSDAAALELRDLAVHGDSEGPSFDELVNRGLKEGKAMDDVYLGIISSAQRSNANLDDKYAPTDGGHR